MTIKGGYIVIEKYKKLYIKSLYISLILTLVFSLLCISLILVDPVSKINIKIVSISAILMICSIYIGILVIPHKLQNRLVKELFLDNSNVVEIIVERCVMWKNIETLSEKEKNIFHISEDKIKKFYLKKEPSKTNSYRLVITDESYSNILQEIYEDSRNFGCSWIINFDKYYKIKKK